ncbi:hypothetical protein KM043_008277 [Ampulex compressa]|nr:hypothetical protein KM043_008277 [Ampulex compressa]
MMAVLPTGRALRAWRDVRAEGVHTSMGRIISAGCRKINKRNITSAAGSTGAWQGPWDWMGKTRWEWVAQALLETLTASRGSGGSAVRPLEEERKGKEEAAVPRRTRRRKGKRPEESTESYEIWPPYGGVCAPRCRRSRERPGEDAVGEGDK